MSKQTKLSYVFMILSNHQVKSVRIIKTQSTLDKYSKLYPFHSIEEFKSEEDAIKFIQNHNYPLDMKKQQYYMKVSEAREAIVSGNEALKRYTKGKISVNNPELEQQQQDEGLHQFLKQSEALYNYYSQSDNIIQDIAKNIIRDQFYHLRFDGASKNNPGPSGAGFAIFSGSNVLYEKSIHTGFKTINQAEYLGLLYGLNAASNLGIQYLHVQGNSSHVISQMNNFARVKDRNLILYNSECKKLRLRFQHTNFKTILKTENEICNFLATKAANEFQTRGQANQESSI